jgi:hypothetical protein
MRAMWAHASGANRCAADPDGQELDQPISATAKRVFGTMMVTPTILAAIGAFIALCLVRVAALAAL